LGEREHEFSYILLINARQLEKEPKAIGYMVHQLTLTIICLVREYSRLQFFQANERRHCQPKLVPKRFECLQALLVG
jgi:hypothetical protein